MFHPTLRESNLNFAWQTLMQVKAQLFAAHNLLGSIQILRLVCICEGGLGHSHGVLRSGCGHREMEMSAVKKDIVIKKYANRRLYNTGTSTYVTLEDLSEMVKKGEEFTVQDAKTGEDITHSVLTQIIFELENKDGQNMLPIPFLRQLIAFYGDQMQMVVPSFLEQSLKSFSLDQDRIREQLTSVIGKTPIGMMGLDAPMKAMEETVRRNTEMFQNALTMFTPFAAKPDAVAPAAPVENDGLSELKEQIAAMQRKIETLGKK